MFKEKSRNWISIVVLLVMLIGTTSLAASQAAEQEIRLGYLPTSGHALTFVAKRRVLRRAGPGCATIPVSEQRRDGYNALTAGKLDVIAMGSTAPAVYIAKGTDLRYIGGLMGEGAAVIAQPERADELSDIKDFKEGPSPR